MHRLTRLALLCSPFVLLAAGYGKAWVAPEVARAAPPQGEEAGQEASPLRGLAWMTGSRQGSGLGGSVEEHWSRPAGGSMIGMFRLVQKGETSFTQYMLVEEEQGGVVLRFQHFNPGYAPWEEDGPLRFELVEAEAGKAVFESPDPKQTPARLVYRDLGGGALSCLMESPQALGGPISFEILLKRAERP